MSYERMWNDLQRNFTRHMDTIQGYLHAPPWQKEQYKHKESYCIPAYPALELRYPGYKTKPGTCDYVVLLNNAPITHEAIAQDFLYKAQACNNTPLLPQLKKFLYALAHNGDSAQPADFSSLSALGGIFTIQQLCHLVPWIALQEDVNYPTWRGASGRKMLFCRYVEAICLAQYPDVLAPELDWERLKNRIHVTGRPPSPIQILERYGEYAQIHILCSPAGIKTEW